ncbi:carbamoyl-phosphate synthase large subunit [Singulisphaera acidiphila]|uniref:Carbamoyl phosphate synthase large chain n=2 Tax=Singulisphaera acidiphila TaxID=466153 RepID=L0D7N3_SINAD|nr:carbamoyl-phosphate synthase large subunit [Singulisphaera acidiphila]AGA24661.1 carbamoyl-phosphate synthase, large subunit [Singulisphaera acidiphila DSM 18658]
MPKRTDLKTILIIGAGPIVIGQACEFDYSGTQACKALREEGYRVVLVNSNPATIMTDPDMADRTYVEPITPEFVERIIAAERPDAVLPTLGGQTGLNVALALHDSGALARYDCKLIGATAEAIRKAEDRQLFKVCMEQIGLESARSGLAHNLDEARGIRDELGLPCVLRPSFTMGGSGGGVAYNRDEFDRMVAYALELSPVHSVLIEESLVGWKEYEMEVMRDEADNAVIICSIENLDPLGVHTGDSVTVAPAQTLTDKEYQRMRDASLAILREIGVETGGSNVQFAINPDTGRMVVIEMNPRVSRSSALASKATGFPIAKIAAKLAVGYRLDELRNDITGQTCACFEPSIDYVVTKVPRWAFEKFPEASTELTTQMKSVGEVMAIGRTFRESLQKALRGLEVGRFGLGADPKDRWGTEDQPGEEEIQGKLATPNPERLWFLRYAMLAGMSIDRIHELTAIDRWFLVNIAELVETEATLRQAGSLERAGESLLRLAKRDGFSDRQLAHLWGSSEAEVRRERKRLGVEAVYKLVDTCAAEFEATTPYYYSTYESTDEARVSDKPRVVVLGGGPNRIGQGIEFDYCCCQAAFALRRDGYEVVMVNSNPETVSTDYDTSDSLFFEPLTAEDVLNVCERVKPVGVIVQFGGQTPLNLARALEAAGVPILGTTPESIELAEDRERFHAVIERLGLRQPPSATALKYEEARRIAERIGYPVVVRPSFVLGGRGMEIVYDESALARYMTEAVEASAGHPILIDKFLEDAQEVDVDAVSDGERTIVAGVMEHIEEAGIHSGDSACAIPPFSLSAAVVTELKRQTRLLADAIRVRGLMNIQFAVKDGEVYVLEVNPRASRTVPFVSKATGLELARAAARVMAGRTLAEQGIVSDPEPSYVSVKESVFPFAKFAGVDIVLGPEMRSTGEVMGIAPDFAGAFAKAQLAASISLPESGTVFVSVAARDRQAVLPVAARLSELGYDLMSTAGTAAALTEAGIAVSVVRKIREGRPNLLDHLANGSIALIVNTPSGKGARTDEGRIRASAVSHGVPCITTIAGGKAAVAALERMRQGPLEVYALQDLLKKS